MSRAHALLHLFIALPLAYELTQYSWAVTSSLTLVIKTSIGFTKLGNVKR